MKNKYYNDAIIGNGNMVASFSKRGEMLRLFYPSADYKQFIDEMYTGVKVNDSALVLLHDDINNQYEQCFTPNTNILNTRIKNTYFNIAVEQTDFISTSKDVLIKKYKFTNENVIDLDVSFLAFSRLLTNPNNMVSTKIEDDIAMMYTHDYTYCMFSKSPMLGHRLHNVKELFRSGILHDKDYIGIGEDCAISYDIGVLKPGESKQIEIFIYIKDNKDILSLDTVMEEVNKFKSINVDKELKETEKYWNKYITDHDGLRVLSNKEEWERKVPDYDRMKNIYIRSILLFPLLSNAETGGISAAIEIDEGQTKCGRYSYCWPRDAVFITKALDLLNMKDQTTKFYTIFAKQTQSKNGMWEQRYYTDGKLAPSWGYQIDETASIVYGVYEHFKIKRDKQFLIDTYDMCKKAIEALDNFCNVSSSKIERFKTHEGYDLWEMNEGVHLYSMSAVYGAFKAMIHIEKELNEKPNTKELEDTAERIKDYCMQYFTNEESRTLKRSNKDNVCDISTLGTVVPFEMFSSNSQEVLNTIERMDMTLRTYTGGYLRFENDSYLDGNYPWPIATLWMALYNLKNNDEPKAIELIDFVTNTQTDYGYLAEQVDNENMQAKWVIGLGWSHAMYIIALSQL